MGQGGNQAGKCSASTVFQMLGFPDGPTQPHLALPLHCSLQHGANTRIKSFPLPYLDPSQDFPPAPLEHSPPLFGDVRLANSWITGIGDNTERTAGNKIMEPGCMAGTDKTPERVLEVREGLLEEVTWEPGFECRGQTEAGAIWAQGTAMQRACGSNELSMFEKQPGGQHGWEEKQGQGPGGPCLPLSSL